MMTPAIAIVGDYNSSYEAHTATSDAIGHCSAALGLSIDHHWLDTEELTKSDGIKRLAAFSGIWVAPAGNNPYKSMEGVLSAIRRAREHQIPLLGTCGGFQHIILEYARNVLGLADAQHEGTDPDASCLFISRLACSLVGRNKTVTLHAGSMVARLYGRTSSQEHYLCSFGVNPDCVDTLSSGTLRIVGSDDEGTVRVVELAEHPFFVGTLFVPQLTSTSSSPHPLVLGFIRACMHDTVA